MDILAACLSGIVIKVYDDLTDMNIIQDGFLKECLHTLSCFLLAASAMNDFTFSVILYIVNLAYHFGDSESFSQIKEKTILYTYPVFLLLTLTSIRTLNIVEILIIIIATFSSFIEASVIKEDVSVRKLVMRVGFCGGLILGICLFAYFGVLSISVLKLFLFGFFYLLTSCGFQSYELFFKHVKVGIDIDETPFKHIMQYMALNIA
jgi:hypothetical protein